MRIETNSILENIVRVRAHEKKEKRKRGRCSVETVPSSESSKSAAAASVRGGGAAACEGWSRRGRSLSENSFAFGKVVVVK